ncbi:YlaF family protein [Neobacillus sp. PS3-34]|uniref:YlaF family protein n=1 Tax=Neobacillus sp. PS3-34 TaxID=3070678 RepID=UPI0027DF32C3|nr:YlaF family protein [Neobacillus sp. PS3-34]WML49394.1 YlaF family protein [Neobacillus sp. PS3-34]
MKQIKWVLLVYAILSAFCMMGIGVAIGERSIIGGISCIVLLVLVMGFGFKTKKKMRENGQL